MKNSVKFIFFILSLIIIFRCSTGYTSAGGAMLEKYLEPESLLTLTEEPDSAIWIIDVRPGRAYKRGHIPTALSYPSTEIMDRLDELPLTQYLIFYCETGGRAQSVINKLEEEDYTRMLNWGGYTRWPYEMESAE